MCSSMNSNELNFEEWHRSTRRYSDELKNQGMA